MDLAGHCQGPSAQRLTALPSAVRGDISPRGQQTGVRDQLCCWLAERLCRAVVVPHAQGGGEKTTTGSFRLLV